MKIGKIVDIHPKDAWYDQLEFLMGTLWDISEMNEQHYAGYLGGAAKVVGDAISCDGFEMETTYFYRVKFEPINN